ncbi:MAG: hypothetical protein PWR01_2633 [Clostridiales bacterium]|nr:hypothetical protein [Clostridiales bacterium]MDN5281560.1 hypothetical protein [Candidatus Ozemobacter sp.]
MPLLLLVYLVETMAVMVPTPVALELGVKEVVNQPFEICPEELSKLPGRVEDMKTGVSSALAPSTVTLTATVNRAIC